MVFLNRLIAFAVSGSLAFLFYKLDERAISKGNYIRSWGRGKTTLWSFPFYFSFIFTLVFGAALLGFLD